MRILFEYRRCKWLRKLITIDLLSYLNGDRCSAALSAILITMIHFRAFVVITANSEIYVFPPMLETRRRPDRYNYHAGNACE